jgi:hypothetical protein
MSVLYDIPEGKGCYITGPAAIRVIGANEPVIDDPANIVPNRIEDERKKKQEAKGAS